MMKSTRWKHYLISSLSYTMRRSISIWRRVNVWKSAWQENSWKISIVFQERARLTNLKHCWKITIKFKIFLFFSYGRFLCSWLFFSIFFWTRIFKMYVIHFLTMNKLTNSEKKSWTFVYKQTESSERLILYISKYKTINSNGLMVFYILCCQDRSKKIS